MRLLRVGVLALFFPCVILPESPADVRALLEMEPAQAKRHIQGLTAQEAAEAVSQVRLLFKERAGEGTDQYYYLLDHLATLRANALAGKRLQNLLLVIVLLTLLFSCFAGWVFFDQRRSLLEVRRLLEARGEEKR